MALMCAGSTLSQLGFAAVEKIRSILPEGFCEIYKSSWYSPCFFLHPKYHHSLSPLMSPSPLQCLSWQWWGALYSPLCLCTRMLAGTSSNLVWNTNLFIHIHA